MITTGGHGQWSYISQTQCREESCQPEQETEMRAESPDLRPHGPDYLILIKEEWSGLAISNTLLTVISNQSRKACLTKMFSVYGQVTEQSNTSDFLLTTRRVNLQLFRVERHKA